MGARGCRPTDPDDRRIDGWGRGCVRVATALTILVVTSGQSAFAHHEPAPTPTAEFLGLEAINSLSECIEAFQLHSDFCQELPPDKVRYRWYDLDFDGDLDLIFTITLNTECGVRGCPFTFVFSEEGNGEQVGLVRKSISAPPHGIWVIPPDGANNAGIVFSNHTLVWSVSDMKTEAE